MADFNPSQTGSSSAGIFGLPYSAEESRLHILPIPWEVTTSYGGGTSKGPEAILQASPQIDLFDIEFGKAYESGYYMHPISTELSQWNDQLKPLAREIKMEWEEQQTLSPQAQSQLAKVNEGCDKMVAWVYEQTQKILNEKRIPVLLGGDHSSPEGGIQALSNAHKGNFGILHLDAHADLRKAYQGFEHSHASIMYNVMNANWKPLQLVQVGIRDFCEEEYDFIQSRKDIRTFFDTQLKNEMFAGHSWAELCQDILRELPQNVYVSFDIDALNPALCPSTGTPVPGGLSFEQANFLLGALVKSGRKIIGCDLNEVAPSGIPEDEWDGNVGARLLYKLCGWTIKSHE